jgi:hypothetical protein
MPRSLSPAASIRSPPRTGADGATTNCEPAHISRHRCGAWWLGRFITRKEVTPMRRLIALALLIGIALSAVTPASANINCPKYEGYPDCHQNS